MVENDRQLTRYKPVWQLKDGRSEVWVGRDNETRNTVVLKRPAHPLPMHDAALPDWKVEEGWLVMPYYDDCLGRRLPLSLRESFDVLEQLLRACHRWERLGLSRFDLQPAHLFIENGRLIVVDAFLDAGLAGHARYASKETLAGGGGGDPSQDTYCAAVVIHELMTGELPFAGDGLGAVYSKHAGELRVSESLPDLHRFVLARALSVDPGERYTRFADMLADLHIPFLGNLAPLP